MDIAKGIGILIIVFGHSWFVASSLDLLYPLLAVFILPLFFFLSGVFFKPEQPFVEMAVRKADALLKPFFFTMLVYILIRDLLRGQALLPDIGGVLYASVDTIPWQALWFLPHFWVAIISMLLFIAVTWRWWRESRPELGPIRLTKDNAIWLGSTAGILSALVSGFFDHYFSFALVMIALFWLMVGINVLEARRLFPARLPKVKTVTHRKPVLDSVGP